MKMKKKLEVEMKKFRFLEQKEKIKPFPPLSYYHEFMQFSDSKRVRMNREFK